jgi:type II secretory pathway pseudopilin PulG
MRTNFQSVFRKRQKTEPIHLKYSMRFGFTLMELMVSIVVLLAIMIAVSRIFSVTSSLAAIGTATSSTLQQAIAIEQQLRADISKSSPEGFFAIRSVAVANNVRGDYDLLDSSQKASAIVRCDQLIFFTVGIISPMVFSGRTPGYGGNSKIGGQGSSAMVYYGHGLQFPRLDGVMQDEFGTPIPDIGSVESADPVLLRDSDEGVVMPWYEGMIEFETRKYPDAQAVRFDVVPDGDGFAGGTQPNPEEWILCRQVVSLVDDDQQGATSKSKTIYISDGGPSVIAAMSIFPFDDRISQSMTFPQVHHGRVDGAATHLADIRETVLRSGEGRLWQEDGSVINYVDQQELIATLFRWPRVESKPPTIDRADQSLRVAAIAQGCVTFQIEWTYDEGVGEATDTNEQWFPGFQYADQWPQPWWGGSSRENEDDYSLEFTTLQSFYDKADGYPWDGIHTQDNPFDPQNSDVPDLDAEYADVAAWSISPYLIERSFVEGEGPDLAPVPTVEGQTDDGVNEYWAFFGYNNSQPFYDNGLDFVNEDDDNTETDPDEEEDNGDVVDLGWDNGSLPGDPVWRYTPRPSALRITLRLKDPDNRLGAGWTYQFVVDLPERNE